jgi:Arc/MetJ family transcription regulator
MCIDIDPELLRKAMELSGLKSKSAVVELALRTYLRAKRAERRLAKSWRSKPST